MDSPLVEDDNTNNIGRRFLKNSNIGFLLGGGFNTVIDVHDDDTSHQLEGMDKEETKPIRNQRKKRRMLPPLTFVRTSLRKSHRFTS